MPPVGVVCETSIDMRMLGAETASTVFEIIPEGSHVFVGGHARLGEGFASVAVVRYEDYRGDGYITTCMPAMLRPIRTPEQIAADAFDPLGRLLCVVEARLSGRRSAVELVQILNPLPFGQFGLRQQIDSAAVVEIGLNGLQPRLIGLGAGGALRLLRRLLAEQHGAA